MDNTPLDTIVIPAHPQGFNDVFVAENRWPNLKIDQKKLQQVRYIAVYQTKPVSAITHYAEIESFESLARQGRYDVRLRGKPVCVGPIPFTDADTCAIQGPRYTSLSLILKARRLDHAFPS
jgi:hypothetical protein